MAKRKAKSASDDIHMCVDMFPPPDDWERFADLARQEDPTNVITGVRQALAPNTLLPIRAALLTAKKWQNGRTIRVAFMGGSSSQQEFVAKTANKWLDYVNLPLQWGVPTAQSDLRVAFAQNEGAYSFIGTDNLGISKSQKTMNLGWLDEAVVLHEFGHALGLIHEHQHPQNGIPWNKPAVYRFFGGPPNYWDRATIDSNLFQAYSETQTQFSAYDAKSIMHYAIEAQLLTDPSRAVGWNKALSGSDMKFMSEMYPKAIAPPPPPPVEDQMARVSIVGGKLIEAWVGGKKLWPVG